MAENQGSGTVADALGEVVPIPVPAGTADVTLVTGGCFFCGYSLLGNGGAATGVLYDGQDGTGTEVGEVALTSGAVTNVGPSSHGILCRNGLTLKKTSGNIKGAVYVRLLP